MAAFLAGQIPKNKPTIAENVIDPMMALKGIAKGHSLSEAKRYKILVPKNTPMHPPIRQSKIASTINCNIIALCVAPKAFLNPISLVLSVTETSIMFITPIPPTIRLIPAIPAITMIFTASEKERT